METCRLPGKWLCKQEHIRNASTLLFVVNSFGMVLGCGNRSGGLQSHFSPHLQDSNHNDTTATTYALTIAGTSCPSCRCGSFFNPWLKI